MSSRPDQPAPPDDPAEPDKAADYAAELVRRRSERGDTRPLPPAGVKHIEREFPHELAEHAVDVDELDEYLDEDGNAI
jgi:hypothetical protein